MTKYVRSISVIFLMLVSCLGKVHAETWPTRPVKLIALSGAGGAPDIMTRLIGDYLSRTLGKNFYVENAVGAGGITGMRALKSSAADGYTFGFAPASAIVVAPRVFKDVPFDVDNDFVPVSLIGASPIAIAVRSDSRFMTFPDLVAALKEDPSVAIATTLTNSLPHLLGVLTKASLKSELTVVPFGSSPQGVTALLRGDVAAMIDGFPSFQGMLQDEKVRVLATFDRSRSSDSPERPVVAEYIPGVVATGWFAIFAPKATPQPIIEKLRIGIDGALADPNITEKMRSMVVIPQRMPTDKFLEFLAHEKSFWTKAIESSGEQPK